MTPDWLLLRSAYALLFARSIGFTWLLSCICILHWVVADRRVFLC